MSIAIRLPNMPCPRCRGSQRTLNGHLCSWSLPFFKVIPYWRTLKTVPSGVCLRGSLEYHHCPKALPFGWYPRWLKDCPWLPLSHCPDSGCAHALSVVISRTCLFICDYFNSMVYLGPFLWNKLDKNIAEASSLSRFKFHIRCKDLTELINGNNCSACVICTS